MDSQSILTRIKIRRQSLGLTQSDVAEELHMSTANYQKIEWGKLRLNLEFIQGISKVLKLSESEILFGSSTSRLIGKVAEEDNGTIDYLRSNLTKCSEQLEAKKREVELLERSISDKDKMIDILTKSVS